MKLISYLMINLAFLILLPSLNHMKFTSLNPLIDVGKDIYCQHDEKNDTIFQIKKSGDAYTKVYKIIIPNFTAGKIWLKNGTLVDIPNDADILMEATNKDDYIQVKEGEQYFFNIYGANFYNSVPLLFLDENDNFIQGLFAGFYSQTLKGVEITVPSGAKKMHITHTNHKLSVQKVLNMTNDEIDKLCLNENIIMEKLNNSYMKYAQNPVLYKNIKKSYITFLIYQISNLNEKTIELFIEKGIPLSYAIIPESLINVASSGTKTNLEVIRNLIKTGKGEALGLSGNGKLTEESIGNYNEMYKTFIKTKQILNYYGIEANGIISSGGLLFNEEQEKWVSSFYGYSNTYGIQKQYKYICIDSVYYHPSQLFVSFKNDLEKMKESIDKDINEKKYTVYSFNSNDPPQNLSELLDYVKQKEKEGKLEIGNYKEFYEKNTIRMKDLLKYRYTYYVSSNGNSENGLSENDPMNYDTLKSKAFMTGDKILFKRGDKFYGPLLIKYNIVDNNVLTLSCYGDKNKEKPILSGYKIVNKNESWEKESDYIYRIDLTNISKFYGVKDDILILNRIGFMETKNKTKYYNLKSKLSDLTELYDFYSNETYFFVRTNGSTPFEELGELKLSTRAMILAVSSNMKVENLHIQGGNYGIVGTALLQTGYLSENIEIVNNIIEDIGGSFLNLNNTRFGNAIDFYGFDVKNLKVHKNIIRNIYDVAFTIQGKNGGGTNVTVTKNIFCLNSQDSEISLGNDAKGIYNYNFEDNISFMQGRGWGYFARSDKYCAGHILFWGINIGNDTKKTNMSFNHNYVYNPKRIYFVTTVSSTDILFQKEIYVKSDYNHYYMNNDSFIYRDLYNFKTRNNFILDYNKDNNSEFILLDKIDQILQDKIAYSLDYKELRKIFIDDVDNEDEGEEEKNKQKKKNNESTIDNLIQFPQM